MSTNPKIDLASVESLELQITQDDIDEGIPRSASECAIARAFKRVGLVASVAGTVIVHAGDTWVEFRHTLGSRQFVTTYDLRRPIKPATLTFVRRRPFDAPH